MRTLAATVTAIATAMAVTVAQAAPVGLDAASLLTLRAGVSIEVPDHPDDPEPVLVAGFGASTPGSTLAAPWVMSSGSIVWTADGEGVGKPGGRNPGANTAVIDVGVRDVRVAATVAGLTDGPSGGATTETGLAVLSDGATQQVLVSYVRVTGRLVVATPADTLASVDIGSGRSALDTIEVEVRFPRLRILVDGGEVLTVDAVPAGFATNTHHGIHVARDNGAVFTALRIQALS